jgi:hypothetical protein
LGIAVGIKAGGGEGSDGEVGVSGAAVQAISKNSRTASRRKATVTDFKDISNHLYLTIQSVNQNTILRASNFC